MRARSRRLVTARFNDGVTADNRGGSPTSGMFPAQLYHRCWIGNREGEDSRPCRLHEDLADSDTENPIVQKYLIDACNRFIDMGVDGSRVDTVVHIPRVTWNRRFLPAIQQHATAKFGEKGRDFFGARSASTART